MSLCTQKKSGSALAGPGPPIIVGRAPAASALASAARLRNSSRSGCSRPLSSCISSPGARFRSTSSGSTSGRRRARLGPSASSGLTHTFAELLHTVSRVRTVVLVNTSSASPSSLKVAILKPLWHLLFQPTEIPCKAMGSKLPRRTLGCFNFIANAKQPQGGHELGLFLGNKSHSACPEKAHLSNTIGSTMSLCPGTHRLLWMWTSFACSAASGQRHTGAFVWCTRDRIPRFRAPTLSSTRLLRLDRRLQLWCEGLRVLSASRQLRPQTLVLHHFGTAKHHATTTTCRSSHL